MEESTQVDFLSKVISTLIPATVAECARRFNDIATTSYSPNSNLMTLVEKISGDLVKECDFDPEESVADRAELPPELQSKLAIIGETNELGHIQNLKFDLHDLYQEFLHDLKENIVAELKDSIKAELHMELFMELSKMRSQMNVQPHQQPVTPVKSSAKIAGAMPEFSIVIDDSIALDDVAEGFDSIADKLSFDSVGKSTTAEEDSLKDNLLYQMVTRGLERTARGHAAYTADEIVTLRGDRFDAEHIAEFKKRVAESEFDYEDESDDEAEQWNKIANEKFTAGL